jgi:hypothetical protein
VPAALTLMMWGQSFRYRLTEGDLRRIQQWTGAGKKIALDKWFF